MILKEINRLLRPLVTQIKLARQLDLQIKSLEEQVALAKLKLGDLGQQMHKEEDDIIRLQNRKLPVRAAKWDKEESEYKYAKHEYEEALYMASHMNHLLKILQEQRQKIGDPERLYAELLQVKQQTIVNEKHPALPILIEQEEKILELEVELREINDALEAIESLYARIDHLFKLMQRLENVGNVWWGRERRRYEARIEEAAFEVHQANHKILRELLDVKKTYRIANGDRMRDFYNIFLSQLSSSRGDLDTQISKGKNLCRSQVAIVNEVFHSLNLHKNQLDHQLQNLRKSQTRIIENA
ncbi:MAG: hypothetical protein MRZ79_11085 [Bacteroidia bacterium]|nr:hypothetical protein [Bacteroidia bacterium]